MKSVYFFLLAGLLENSFYVNSLKDEASTRIYVGLFKRDKSEFQQQCGAALLSTNIILTLAICFTDRSHMELEYREFRSGEINLQPATDFLALMNINENPIQRNLDKYVIHPDWEKDREKNNLALGRFKEPIPKNVHMQTAIIPHKKQKVLSCSYVTGIRKNQTVGRTLGRTEILNKVQEIFQVVPIEILSKGTRTDETPSQCIILGSTAENDTVGGCVPCGGVLAAITDSLFSCMNDTEGKEADYSYTSKTRRLLHMWRHHDWIKSTEDYLKNNCVVKYPRIISNILMLIAFLEKLFNYVNYF